MWGSCPQKTIIILLTETTPLLCLLGLLGLLACLFACLFACLACLGHLSHWPCGALGFQIVGNGGGVGVGEGEEGGGEVGGS